jgi:hypothetical protein
MTQCPKFSFWWMKVTAWKNYKVLQASRAMTWTLDGCFLHLDSGIRVPTHTDSRTFIWPPSPMALSQDLANNRHQLSIAPD